MKPIRITTTHQSITFSRRMLVLGGAQATVGALLIGRLGWLAIAQNEKYQLLSENNRVQLIPVPPRRGWIIDRYEKPIAINKASFRVDIIPQQLEKGRDIIPEVSKLLDLDPDDVDRIRKELAQSRGFQPVSVADNVPYEQYAAITVRLPDLPGVAASIRAGPRSDSSSAMSDPPRPRSMRRRGRTRSCWSPASRSARRGSKRR
jgi:penicillin-binding protein 2